MITAALGTALAGDVLQAQLRVDGALLAGSPVAQQTATANGAFFNLMWETSGLALGNHTVGIQIDDVTNGARTTQVLAAALASAVVHDIGDHAP